MECEGRPAALWERIVWIAMKNRKKRVVAIVVIAVLVLVAAGLYFAPIFTLLKIREDVSAHGLEALKPYMAEELQVPFHLLLSASRGLSALGNLTQSVMARLSDNASISDSGKDKWSLVSFARGFGTAQAVLQSSNKSIPGPVTLCFRGKALKWVISNIKVPALGWSIG